MSQCQVISPLKSSYNAVNIKINNPRANVTDNRMADDGELNAVSLEINNPEIRQKSMYSYPVYDAIVTADMADIMPVAIPEMTGMPVAYKTSLTYISTEPRDIDSVKESTVRVPEPYVTTQENEKKNKGTGLTFNGISFKKSDKPQIVADAKMKPAIDVENVVNNLYSADYDVQAKQLAEIVNAVFKDKKSAIPYITTAVFKGIISIAEKDSSSLNGPADSQIEIRKKIITNEIVRQQQLAENKKPEEIELPYKISPIEFAEATVLSEMELAERNKEYAILTLAALSKVYAEEFEAKTGNKLMLTDLPGISTIVETLKNSDNMSVKMAAIDALVYLNCPEYKDEISSVLKIVSKDSNKAVAMYAKESLKNIE